VLQNGSCKQFWLTPEYVDFERASRRFLGALDGIEESEFKREDTRESINEGLAHAKARGVRLDRPVKINAYCEDVARLRAQGRIARSRVFRIIGAVV
jgi:DNA invertase Pin-like site-specific DNA recombinase